MVLPNFLVIGAAKAGTSSVYSYLKQHPEIYMSEIKEPKFFSLEGEELDFAGPSQYINHTSINNLDSYRELFEDVKDEIAIGEASPLYLYSAKAAQRIKHYIPQAKLIVILRHPAERAFSSFAHLVREGFETSSFEAGLEAEPQRIADKWAPLWYYQDKGFYARQLKPYFELFDRQQIKVYLYEELQQDAIALIQDMYRFLEVSPDFVPDLTRKNVSGVPKSRFFHSLLTQDNSLKTLIKTALPKGIRKKLYQDLKSKNLGSKPVMSEATRNRLNQLYQQDILELQTLIDRDLSNWLVAQ